MEHSVLITGGAGFLGGYLARDLARRGERVVVYDNFTASLPENLTASHDRIKLVQGDTLDLSFLIKTMQAENVNRIIHAAAIVGSPASIPRPVFTARVNIEGTVNVLEASKILGIERVLDISSEEVYGPFRYEPADEDHPFFPTMPYAVTKLAAERYEQFYHEFRGLDIVIIRTSWVYGPGLPRSRPPKTFIENSLKGIPTQMKKGGNQRVDHTHIEDFVQGAVRAFEVKEPKNRIFNISSGTGHTFEEMARMVEEIVPGVEITVGSGLLEYAEGIDAPQKGALSIKRAQSELGYQPKYHLYNGLAKYADSIREGRG